MVFFTSNPVSKHLTRITTPCGVCMYLVQGSRRAALLDTGFGLGDLKGYLEDRVKTPYLVLLSHGHLDHAGGAGQFEEVWLSEKDWALEKRHCTLEHRLEDLRNGPGGMPPGAAETDLLPSRTAPYRALEEGMEFDLGGVTVRPLALPGHTAGSMVFLIPEERIAIFGDCCGENTLLLLPESLPIQTYARGLERLAGYAGLFDRVLRNHGGYESPKQILADSIELCGQILSRTDAAEPVCFMGRPGLLARPKVHQGKAGNILYDPNNLWEA